MTEIQRVVELMDLGLAFMKTVSVYSKEDIAAADDLVSRWKEAEKMEVAPRKAVVPTRAKDYSTFR